MKQGRTILLRAGHATLEVKRSRFEAHALPMEAIDQLADLLTSVVDPKATHNAWAYVVGEGRRHHDDGEVGGTAGRPALMAIDGRGLDATLVVVTRYYGGIKLGTGGLIRAYGGAAAAALDAAELLVIRPTLGALLRFPFALTGIVYPVLQSFGIEAEGERYHAAGVELELNIDLADRAAFTEAIREASAARAELLFDEDTP